MNARYQYIPTIKEQASFMITGLIIIEMALNIQGRLGYELLQNVLYRDYQVAAFIVLAIFAVVKVTEIVVDLWHQRESRRFENRPA
jgi:ABC-type dipeptide/oligopeptide/nickel transport system permease component